VQDLNISDVIFISESQLVKLLVNLDKMDFYIYIIIIFKLDQI